MKRGALCDTYKSAKSCVVVNGLLGVADEAAAPFRADLARTS